MSNYLKRREEDRLRIAQGVRRLRLERRWTQAELAEKLGLSQARLSEIERGGGSFTAEQLLLMLRLFNVPASHFISSRDTADPEAAVQNTLARLGAHHLHESEQVLPSERFDEVSQVAREALVIGTPRLVTALAPVLVQQIDRLSLARLDASLRNLGLDRRLPWLAENVVQAIHGQPTAQLSPALRRSYRRAEAVLQDFVELARRRSASATTEIAPDVLERSARSKRTLDDLRARGSEVSRRWGIVSSLQPQDFAKALEEARAGD